MTLHLTRHHHHREVIDGRKTKEEKETKCLCIEGNIIKMDEPDEGNTSSVHANETRTLIHQRLFAELIGHMLIEPNNMFTSTNC